MDQLIAKMNQAPGAIPNAPSSTWGFYDYLEKSFDFLGLMRGDWAILKRFIFGAGIATIAIMWVQPNFAFVGGQFRPWKALSDSEDVPSTWFPWWMAVSLIGLIPAVFI